MTIKQLAEDIEKFSKLANTDLDELSPAVRAGWASTIENSKTKLKELERQYSQQVARNSAAVLLLGPADKAQQLADLIKSKGEGFVVDASALYRRLAQHIMPTMRDDGRSVEWGITQTSRLIGALREIGPELGLTELPMPDRVEQPSVATFDDVLRHVKHVIRSSSGESLNKLYIEKELVKQALAIRYTGAVVQVIVLGASEDEAYDLGRMFGFGCFSEILSDEDEVGEPLMLAVFERATAALSRGKRAAISGKDTHKEATKKDKKDKTDTKTKKIIRAKTTAGADETTDAQAREDADELTNEKE